ncbi:hypothetical protein HYH02_007369 [Chlamydomonas schloesseri]|uniref:Protein kinase domain-containing protein n=1 Tax=Chlamydomonas schloesseri TaxID=2026947 RepID=A0A835WJ91_9CHLO|nr:hypothetical protein HYH02_007369 [Chlamydomonas schloesseri]|eukprot:KAG2447915.1 hypothetical protein HYH02_007369 [Chlamydomonas schloesseri]
MALKLRPIAIHPDAGLEYEPGTPDSSSTGTSRAGSCVAMVHTASKQDERAAKSTGVEEQGRVWRLRAKLRKLLVGGPGPSKQSQKQSLRSHASAVDLSAAERAPSLQASSGSSSGGPAAGVSGRTGNRPGTAGIPPTVLVPDRLSGATAGVALRPTTPPTHALSPLSARASPCYPFLGSPSSAVLPGGPSGQRVSSPHLGVVGCGPLSPASSSGLASPAGGHLQHAVSNGSAAASPVPVRQQQAQLLQAPPPLTTLRRAASFGPNAASAAAALAAASADARYSVGSSSMNGMVASGSSHHQSYGGASAAASPTAAAGCGPIRSSHSVGHMFVGAARPTNIVSVPEDKALAVDALSEPGPGCASAPNSQRGGGCATRLGSGPGSRRSSSNNNNPDGPSPLMDFVLSHAGGGAGCEMDAMLLSSSHSCDAGQSGGGLGGGGAGATLHQSLSGLPSAPASQGPHMARPPSMPPPLSVSRTSSFGGRAGGGRRASPPATASPATARMTAGEEQSSGGGSAGGSGSISCAPAVAASPFNTLAGAKHPQVPSPVGRSSAAVPSDALPRTPSTPPAQQQQQYAPPSGLTRGMSAIALSGFSPASLNSPLRPPAAPSPTLTAVSDATQQQLQQQQPTRLQEAAAEPSAALPSPPPSSQPPVRRAHSTVDASTLRPAPETPPGPPGVLMATSACMPREMARREWRLEDYTLLKKLYKGNYSAVHKALCRTSMQLVVVKVYDTTRMTELARNHVKREAALHSALEHDNILRLYAVFAQGPYVVLIEEVAEGGDLYHVLKHVPGHRLHEDRAVAGVLSPLLRALSHLHAQGVVHRDIKLENILFSDRHHTHMLLADFGIALSLRQERAVTRAGTTEYMSPEQLRCPFKRNPDDNKDRADLYYGAGVDVWATGVLAYELLHGYPPFLGSNREETEALIATAPVQVSSALSAGARDFVLSCLQKDPALRPTVPELLAHPWIRINTRQLRAHRAD